MKKKKHAGFSMVEIIIVIAIMVILAAALAPMLIKYIRKARRSQDVDVANEIQAAYMRAAVEMEHKDNTLTSYGSGTTLIRYDTVLNTPAQTIEDYVFSELGGIPESSTFSDYYWEIEYLPDSGRVTKITLTPGQGSNVSHELFPDSDAFLEGK